MDPVELLEKVFPFIFLVIWIILSILSKRKGGKDTALDEKYQEEEEEYWSEVEQQYSSDTFERPVVGEAPVIPAAKPVFIDYKEQLEQQRRKLEESKERLDAARRQAKLKRKALAQKKISAGKQTLAEDVRDLVKDPQAARKGFIAYEIFGAPVSIRDNGKLGPLWD